MSKKERGKLSWKDAVEISYTDPAWTKIKNNFKDAKEGEQTLTAYIAATHSGTVIRNNRLYLPDRMEKGTPTFVQDFGKPILLHHDDHQDNVGRVVKAEYVDTSSQVKNFLSDMRVKDSKRFGKVTDQLIEDFVSGKMPFGQQVDTIRKVFHDTILKDAGYQGMGFIKLTAKISDPDAIQKLFDGRYFTGSVGASTDSAVCSVCREDWAENGPCEHQPGSFYDDVKCFLITGDLEYDEYSFVNVPADRHSKVLQLDYNGQTIDIDTVQDSVSTKNQVWLSFPQEEESTMLEDESKNTTEKVQDNKDPDPTPDSNTNTEVNDDVNTEENKTETEPKGDEKSLFDQIMEEEDHSKVELSDEQYVEIYNMLWDEAVAAVKDGALPLSEDELKEKKLTDELRKKLPKSKFCGPARALPVHDCTHVVAVRRLMDSYTGPGDKKAILECLDRKGKALGCATKAQDSKEVKDNIGHSRMLRMVLSVLDDDTYYTSEPVLNDDEKRTLQSIIQRMAKLVGKDSFKAVLVAEDMAQDETALLSEIEDLESQLGEVRDRLDASLKEHHILYTEFNELQDSLVEEKTRTRGVKEEHLRTLLSLADKKVVDGKDFQDFSTSELDDRIKTVKDSVDMTKITDKLGDGLARTPSESSVESPADSNTTENKEKEKIDVVQANMIADYVMYLRKSRGDQAAAMYLADMRAKFEFPNENSQTTQGGE